MDKPKKLLFWAKALCPSCETYCGIFHLGRINDLYAAPLPNDIRLKKVTPTQVTITDTIFPDMDPQLTGDAIEFEINITCFNCTQIYTQYLQILAITDNGFFPITSEDTTITTTYDADSRIYFSNYCHITQLHNSKDSNIDGQESVINVGISSERVSNLDNPRIPIIVYTLNKPIPPKY